MAPTEGRGEEAGEGERNHRTCRDTCVEQRACERALVCRDPLREERDARGEEWAMADPHEDLAEPELAHSAGEAAGGHEQRAANRGDEDDRLSTDAVSEDATKHLRGEIAEREGGEEKSLCLCRALEAVRVADGDEERAHRHAGH